MKNLSVLIIGICLLGLIWQPLKGLADTEIPDVIINEVAWAGSSVSSADEWIELKNTTDTVIDLSGWQITKLDSAGQEVLMIELPSDNLVLLPKDYFLIANNSQDHIFSGGESVLHIDPDYITSAVSLSDTTLKISLYVSDWNNGGQLVDVAGNGTKPFYPGDSSTKISMERNAMYKSGDIQSSWHEANTTTNLDTDVPDKGTPKAENSIPPPPPLEAPKIISINPDQVESETIWEISEILGENFIPGVDTKIKLEKGTQTIWAIDITVISPTTIDIAKFDLTDAEPGKWDLIVINPDGQIATLPNAVEILEPEEEPEIPVYSTNIIINELYPHPSAGTEEYIELYNTGNSTVNLKGWKLDDQSPGGSAGHIITSDTFISPHQYLIFPKSQTHISLNDTGDYACIFQPNNNLLEITPNYGTATTGYAYAKINSNWQWTKRVTPNSVNIYESIIDDDETDITDQEGLQEDEITIELDSETTKEKLTKLIWEINWPGALGEIKIYQSEKKNYLGNQIGQTSPQNTEYLLDHLSSKTKYFFTIVGNYNGQDIKSNQIEITTTNTQTTSNSGIPKQIVISEILPNPNVGESEFIELYNPTNQDVNISGWKLQDASGKTYVITVLDLEEITIAEMDQEVILKPNQYLLLEYPVTNIRLNNSGGEEVKLLDITDTVIDTVAYTSSAKQGFAYVLAPNEQWFWSNETTPGEANDISFADILGDNDNYLIDSGTNQGKLVPLWISLILSVIILTYVKTNYLNNSHH